MILYYILVPFAWILWHIGFRIRVEGRENLKKVQTKGCILAPTHVSAIDPVFIVVTRWSRRMVVFAKKELFEINGFLTWFFRCCGAVCVRGTKDEMAAIEQTVEACKNGKTLPISCAMKPSFLPCTSDSAMVSRKYFRWLAKRCFSSLMSSFSI